MTSLASIRVKIKELENAIIALKREFNEVMATLKK